MSLAVFIFDAYGTLFDVHACIARYAAEARPEGQRMSEIWPRETARIPWEPDALRSICPFLALTKPPSNSPSAPCPGSPAE